MTEKEKYIAECTEQFETLLREQLNRIDKMSGESKRIEKGVKNIGLIDGDGIGPVIMESADTILSELLDDELKSGDVSIKKIEGLTIENRELSGQAVPSDVLDEIKTCDVILKGPTATPKGGNLESANVALRRELDLFANVRPIRIEAEGIDWTFFRENTEGEYVLGSRGIELPGMAIDFKVITDIGTERIARAAFDFARNNGKKNLAIVTKANIMKKTDGKFSETCNRIAKDYPEVHAEDWYVDIMAANLVNPEIRNKFEVFVLPNLYGDILTDEAAELQGGVGTAGSANIGERYAMFEAVHGTAPRLIEEGLQDYANPISILKATAMLLAHIGYIEKSRILDGAIEKVQKELVVKKVKTIETTQNIMKLL